MLRLIYRSFLQICRIVCKNRGLNEDTVKLFLDMSATTLALYDCARQWPRRLLV